MHNTETLSGPENGVSDHFHHQHLHNNHHQHQLQLHPSKAEIQKSTICVKAPSAPQLASSAQSVTAIVSSTLPQQQTNSSNTNSGPPTVLRTQNPLTLFSGVNTNGNNNSTAACSAIRECAGCFKQITERFLLKALDLYWHEDCLKCGCCDCRLGEVGSTLYTKANLILCKRDYLRLFGTTGYCAACNKVIPAFEMVMRARSNVYHLECFACQQCNNRFCVGDRFYLCENKILCEYDYEERLVFANMAYNPSSLAHIHRQVSSLQPAGDSNMNTNNGGNIGIGCKNNNNNNNNNENNISNNNTLSKDHAPNHQYNCNQFGDQRQSIQKSQQKQTQQHRDSGYGSSPDSEPLDSHSQAQ